MKDKESKPSPDDSKKAQHEVPEGLVIVNEYHARKVRPKGDN